MLFLKEFEYPNLDRFSTEKGRQYVSPSGQLLYSVTTILDATKSEETKTALKNWAKWKGEKEADLIRNQSASLGTLLHDYTEKYLLNQEIKFGNNLIHQMAKSMFLVLKNQGLAKIQSVYGLESRLYFEGLYAGSTDLIARIDEEIVICDFKNSLKIKKLEHMSDYFDQLCSYALAHDNMYNTNIRRGRIMMVVRPDKDGICDYKEFDLEGLEFDKHCESWVRRLEKFLNKI